MGAIQDIFRQFAPAYLAHYGDGVPAQHRRVIEAICQCRTDAYGAVCYQCEDCGQPHVVPAACGNRHCPQCQHRKARLWLERQIDRQVPGHHFMLTFTVPEPLRAFLRSHQKIGYGALFAASSAALKKLIADPRHVGGQAGFFGVLHTWGRQLQYHPHIHYIVAGGALSSRDGAWHPASQGFLVPVRALSRIVRAKFRDHMKRAGLFDAIAPEVWRQAWNVNSQAVPTAEASINYLAPYVFKVAIADSRICAVSDEQITITWKKPGSSRHRHLRLAPFEFIRRFLQHVLPSGLMKVRYYGFLSPTSKVPLEAVRAKVAQANGLVPDAEPPTLPAWPQPLCRACGGHLRFHHSSRVFRGSTSSMTEGPPTAPLCNSA